jgi:hypothetical protein
MSICRISAEKILSFLTIWPVWRVLRNFQAYVCLEYFAQLFSQREMFQSKVAQNTKTHCKFNNVFPKIVLLMTMWKNMAEPDRLQMTWRMRIACWITKATHAHTHTHTHSHTQNMKYLLFDNNNGDANATLWYVYTYIVCVVTFFRGFAARLKRVSISAVTVSYS